MPYISILFHFYLNAYKLLRHFFAQNLIILKKTLIIVQPVFYLCFNFSFFSEVLLLIFIFQFLFFNFYFLNILIILIIWLV